jgi:hypothetical protein
MNLRLLGCQRASEACAVALGWALIGDGWHCPAQKDVSRTVSMKSSNSRTHDVMSTRRHLGRLGGWDDPCLLKWSFEGSTI